MKNLFLHISLLTISFAGWSQKARLNYANKMYESKSYYFAKEGFEDVLERKVDSMVVAARIADSYDKIGETAKAAEWYNFLRKNNQLNKDQHLRLVVMERGLQNYAVSDQLLANYENSYGATEDVRKLKAETSLTEIQKDKKQFELKLQPVNTVNSEMGASYLSKGEVLLASSKRRSKAVMRLHSWTGNYFYDIYKAPVNEQGEIGKMKLMKSDAKTKFHDGPAVYDEKRGVVYFTRNSYIGGKKQTDANNTVRLKIFMAKVDGRKFKDFAELSINDDNYATAHPTLSADGSKLYFSSDRPGGMGGMDLYSVELNKVGLPQGVAVNLGPLVNTAQNEIFPHYNDKENLLFFSSDGHSGLGGLDVFMAKLDQSAAVRSVENVGAPINSEKDDFSFVNDADQKLGFFSSNRSGGKGDDDIYGFKQLFPFKNSPTIEGDALDLLTNEKLPNSKIYLVDNKGVVIDSTTSDSKGFYQMSLGKINGDFELRGTRDQYVDGNRSVAYDSKRMDYKEDVKLIPILNYFFSGVVEDKDSKQALSDVKITVFDNEAKSNFTTVNTGNNGAFKTGQLPYSYNHQISYEFMLEKDGYVTKEVSLSQLLALKEEIIVNERLSLSMKKIEIGKTDLNDVVDIQPIYFDFNKADIRPDAAIELDKVVKVMKANPGMVIELGSHTDSRGSDALNRTLSDKRAKSSANYIISKGIAKDRITGKGYGETRLRISDKEISQAQSEEEKEVLHQKNRRTEFIIMKMK